MTSHLRLRAAVLAVTALALTACRSISVNYDYDPTASFANLRTYVWRPAADPPVQGLVHNPLLEKAIHDTVSDELSARGFAEAPAGTGADFTVGAFATVRERMDVWSSYDPWFYGGYGGYWHGGYGYWGARTWVTTWDEGTLVLEIADGRTGSPLWRGTAISVIDSDESPEDRRARLRASVHDALANFPPPIE